MVLYTVLLAIEHDVTIVATVLAATSVVLFALAVLIPNGVERLVRLDGLLPVHCLLGFLAAIVLIQIEVDRRERRGLRGGGRPGIHRHRRGSAPVRPRKPRPTLDRLCRICRRLCLVYILMIGSMLGTAGFFLVAGVLLGVMALAIIRIEKRMRIPRHCRPSGMRMSGKHLLLAACLVALAQLGFLSWVIAGRAAILRDGQEVVLKVEPIDPRDLLRGDYVRLGYEIGQVPVRTGRERAPGRIRHGRGTGVRPARPRRRRRMAAALGLADAPVGTPPAAGEVDIRGHLAGGWTLGPRH